MKKIEIIGGGKNVGKDLLKVSVSIEKALQSIHKIDGQECITFYIEKNSNPDSSSNTLCCFLGED